MDQPDVQALEAAIEAAGTLPTVDLFRRAIRALLGVANPPEFAFGQVLQYLARMRVTNIGPDEYCLELALHGCLRGNHHHLATQIICEIEEGFGITSTYAEKVLIKISLRRNALTSADSSIRRLLSEDETCVDSSIFVTFACAKIMAGEWDFLQDGFFERIRDTISAASSSSSPGYAFTPSKNSAFLLSDDIPVTEMFPRLFRFLRGTDGEREVSEDDYGALISSCICQMAKSAHIPNLRSSDMQSVVRTLRVALDIVNHARSLSSLTLDPAVVTRLGRVLLPRFASPLTQESSSFASESEQLTALRASQTAALEQPDGNNIIILKEGGRCVGDFFLPQNKLSQEEFVRQRNGEMAIYACAHFDELIQTFISLQTHQLPARLQRQLQTFAGAIQSFSRTKKSFTSVGAYVGSAHVGAVPFSTCSTRRYPTSPCY